MKEWRKCKLGDVLTFQRGFDITKSEQLIGNVPVVSSSGIQSYHSEFKVMKPGVVIGRKGTLGSVFYIKENYWPHDTTLFVKDFKGNSPRFIYYFLQLLKFERFDVGSANPSLNRNHIHGLNIKFPALEIQHRIASILSAYDDLIENNLKRIKLLEELAQRTYEEWFVQFRVNGEALKMNEETGLPVGWEKKTIGDMIDVGRGSSPRPIADRRYFDNGTIPWLKIADATASDIFIHKTREHVNDFGASFSRRLKPGSLIVAASGTLGFPMFLSVEACIHDGWIYFEGIGSELKEYFYYSFIGLRKYFEAVSYGAAIQNINTGLVKASPFILPNSEILKAFKKIAGPIFENIQTIQKQNTKLKEARDILLPRLMNGSISVEKLQENESFSIAAEPEIAYNK